MKKKNKLPKDKLGRTISEKSLRHYKRLGKISALKRTGRKWKMSNKGRKNISIARIKSLNEGRGNHWICPTRL